MAMYNEITVTAELTNTEYMITKNYNLLQNKPQINSVELMGNKSLEDLGINPDAEENVIDVVKVNGSALNPDANKAVNVTVTTGSDNGTVKVNGSDVAVKGLKSAAFTEATAYDAAGSAAEVQGNVDALTAVVNGKVDKVQGKGLSQNDFTNAYKTKLDGIEAGAQVNTVTSVARKTGAVILSKSDVGLGNVDNTSDLNKPISTATQTALNEKVDKVNGKGLSTNDYTTADKTKLAGIEEEANKTIVDSALSSESENPLQNKAIYDLINDILPEKTATGNPISISDASGFNAKSAKVTMLPIQSGSGDPSPTNIRPISGRDGLNLIRTGKNLSKPYSKTSGIISYDGNGNITVNGTTSGTLYIPTTAQAISDDILFTLKAGTYIPSLSNPYPNSDIFVNVVSKDNVNLSQGNALTLTEDTEVYVRVVVKAGTYNNWTSGIQLEFGSTVTDYEPYTAETKTHQYSETIYGGVDDFVNGVATITYGIVNLGTLNYTLSTERYPRFNTDSLPNIKAPKTVRDLLNGVCEAFDIKTAAETYDGVIGLSVNERGQLRIYAPTYSNVETFKTAMNGVHLVYELATPTETTLTPQSISLNKGDNVLTTDGDNIELKYSVSLDSLLPT